MAHSSFIDILLVHTLFIDETELVDRLGGGDLVRLIEI